jgi:hypothetical protein
VKIILVLFFLLFLCKSVIAIYRARKFVENSVKSKGNVYLTVARGDDLIVYIEYYDMNNKRYTHSFEIENQISRQAQNVSEKYQLLPSDCSWKVNKKVPIIYDNNQPTKIIVGTSANIIYTEVIFTTIFFLGFFFFILALSLRLKN